MNGGQSACNCLSWQVDIITPMMTQITFEGLVDEVTGIRNGSVPWVPRGRHGRLDKTVGIYLPATKGVTVWLEQRC